MSKRVIRRETHGLLCFQSLPYSLIRPQCECVSERVMLSKRWETMFFLFTGATIAYVLRVNMSVCAPKMHDELVSE